MPKDELIAAKYAESLILIAEKYVKGLIVSCEVYGKFRGIEIAESFTAWLRFQHPHRGPRFGTLSTACGHIMVNLR